MGRVRLAVLGPVLLTAPDGTTAVLRGGGAALAGYLAVHASGGRRLRRDRVAFAMWADRPESAARRSLSDAVYRLRGLTRPLGVELLDATDDELGLDPGVSVDVAELETLAGSADPADRRAALELHHGPLLADLDVDWADDARREAERGYGRLIAAVWDDCRLAGDRARALDVARRWIVARPFDEVGHRALLRSLAARGAYDEALDHFAAWRSRCSEELGTEPGDETLHLVAQLRAERQFERRDVPAHRPARLVGRLTERGRLVGLAGRCIDGHGGMAVVLGDAGMGKTRLLDELAAAADWRGAQVSRAVGDERDLLSPRGPLVDVLTQAVPPSRREVLVDLVESVWLRQLDALTASSGPATDGVTVEVGPTVRRVLAGLQRIAPQVWLLDDVHWAHEDVWFVLDDLRTSLATQRIMIVAAARRDELRDRPMLWDLVGEWDASGVPIVQLEPLGDEAVAELVADVAAGAGAPGDDVDAAGIVSAAGGNPLVAIALCGVPAEGGTSASTIADVVRRQVATVGDRDADVLDAAAVLGDAFDYGLWRAVAGDAELPTSAAALERAGLLVPAGRGYRFANAAARHAIVDRIAPARRSQLHASALQELALREPHQVVALLAHAEAAGLRDPIARYALEAGVAALAASSFTLAVTHFRRALETSEGDDVARVALGGLVRALHVLADRDAEREALERLETAAVATGDPFEQATVDRERARWQLATGRFAEALATVEHAHRLLADATGAAPDALRAALSLDLAAALRALGRMDEAHESAALARAGFRGTGDVLGEATATDLLGGIAWAQGDFAAAVEHHAAAAGQFERLGAPSRQARALNNLGSAHWGRGDHAAARQVHEDALALSRALGDRQSEGDNLDNLGGVSFVLGDHAAAIDCYTAALTIRRETDDPWGISISLSNLGDVYRARGDTDHALAHFAESIEVNERAGVVRNEVTTRQSQGLTLVDAGRAAEALPILEAAATRHAELGDHANRQETLVGIARARLALGDPATAALVVDELLDQLRPSDRADLRQIVHLVAASSLGLAGDRTGSGEHLAAAGAAMNEVLQHLSPDDRRRVVAATPHHRATTAALADASERVVVHLAPVTARRGRGVAHEDRVKVTWTLRAPGDPERPTAAGRREVLARLLIEAREQGGVPTDDDLAAALGVSRRTVLRDIDALRGTDLPATRGRAVAAQSQ